MGKPKKVENHITINEVATAVSSNMLELFEVKEPNLFDKEHPTAKVEKILVRADAIDTVEPATIAASWEYREEPENSWMYAGLGVRRGFGYWQHWLAGSQKRDVVRIHIAGQGDKLIESSVEAMKILIDEAEAE